MKHNAQEMPLIIIFQVDEVLGWGMSVMDGRCC